MFAMKYIFEIWGRRFADLPSMTFSSMEALRVDSKEDVAVTMECSQEFLSSARVDHSLWYELHALRDLLSVSLYRLFGAPLSWWPEDSLPYKMIFGKPENMPDKWSFILETCPADRSLKQNNMASILGVSACSRTMMFVTKSLQWMFRMMRRQRWWKRSRSRMWVRYVTQDVK